jgi:hypothetical protein
MRRQVDAVVSADRCEETHHIYRSNTTARLCCRGTVEFDLYGDTICVTSGSCLRLNALVSGRRLA